MKLNKLLLALAASGIATSAFATNGMFAHGNGMTAKGMGGAATAMTKDTFGGANNPATMVWVGNRYDAGADAFSPVRDAGRVGSANMNIGTNSSDNELFLVPEFGYNKMLDAKTSLGVTVYGNGGMNTDYAARMNSVSCAGFGTPTTNTNMLCGTTALGVDLVQLIIAPTVSYKVSDTASVGVSPLFGYQQFSASGLQGFALFSSDSTNLTDRGADSATGFGLRVGGYAKLTDTVSVGGAYATKVDMSKFDKYKGLFAEQGDLDVPANWNIGFSFAPNDKITVGLDFQHIAYSDVKSIANSSKLGGTTISNTLGIDNGRGFGWSDMDIVKLGVEYKYSADITLRAGYSHADSPIQARDVTFNILAPAVIEDHFTLGMTYRMDKDSDLTVSYAHAAENSLTGASLYTDFGIASTETIKMHQNLIGVAYSKKF